jgi:3-deoxy-D-manno-octulosonic-acid transferase
MQALLYSFGLNIMEFLASVVAISNPKVRDFVKGRRNAYRLLEKQLNGNTAPLIWVHCSSVGEFEQGRPVIEAFKKKHPEYKSLVSFYSPSGYNAVRDDYLVDFKTYLPIDSKANADTIIRLANPKLAIFVKYEFWHYYIHVLKEHNIPIFSVSAIFRKEQIYFKWYGGFFKNILTNIDSFFVQDKSSAELLNSLGLSSEITGDTRVDRVIQIKESAADLPVIEAFTKGHPTIAVGSMRKEDLTLIQDLIAAYPKFRFIVAPHEITEYMMAPIESKFNCIRHSKLSTNNASAQVLIIDNIGMLSRLYRYAQFAYVGGGFSDGIHNILEPAAYEIPVFFGNKDYGRFKEAHDLIAINAGFAIGNLKELAAHLNEFIENEDALSRSRNALKDYLKRNQGASEKIIKVIDRFAK